MADKFTEALEELKDALTNGEELEAALAAVAVDYDLRPEAVRNRATTRWGDLAAYREELFLKPDPKIRRKLAARRHLKHKEFLSRIYTPEGPTQEDHNLILWYTGEIFEEDVRILNQN